MALAKTIVALAREVVSDLRELTVEQGAAIRQQHPEIAERFDVLAMGTQSKLRGALRSLEISPDAVAAILPKQKGGRPREILPEKTPTIWTDTLSVLDQMRAVMRECCDRLDMLAAHIDGTHPQD